MKRRILSKTASFHPLFIKNKKLETVLFCGTVGLLLPLFSTAFSFKKTPTKDPHLPKAFHVLEKREERFPSSGGGAAAQWLPLPLSPCISYKYRGRERTKKKRGREEKEQKREKEEEEEEERKGLNTEKSKKEGAEKKKKRSGDRKEKKEN